MYSFIWFSLLEIVVLGWVCFFWLCMVLYSCKLMCKIVYVFFMLVQGCGLFFFMAMDCLIWLLFVVYGYGLLNMIWL